MNNFQGECEQTLLLVSDLLYFIYFEVADLAIRRYPLIHYHCQTCNVVSLFLLDRL